MNKHPEITLDVPKEEQLSESELIDLGKSRMTEGSRAHAVIYVWSRKGYLREAYQSITKIIIYGQMKYRSPFLIAAIQLFSDYATHTLPNLGLMAFVNEF